MKYFKTVPGIIISLALIAFITNTSSGSSDKKLITTFGIISSQKMMKNFALEKKVSVNPLVLKKPQALSGLQVMNNNQIIDEQRFSVFHMIIPCWYEEAQDMSIFPVGTYPCGVAFDGYHIWVTNSGSNNVTELRASDGALLGIYNVGFNPRGIAYDGANIWVANYDSNSVTEIASQNNTLPFTRR
ncbi:MAG: hypothetical protein HYV59_09250 [Planctomycetes bacterium]|nr:hypothetical protein [Planctomycetota bacterium]